MIGIKQNDMKVAIVTPVLAHYRRPLFLLLDRIARFQFVHYSVALPLESDNSLKINAFNPKELQKFAPVQNLKVGSLLWQKGVIRMAVDRRFDACVFTGNVAYLSTWVAGCLARLTGKRVYFWTIGWHRPEEGLKRFVRLAFYRIANRLMVYGDPEKNRAIEHGYPGDRIDVVYNSVTSLDEVDARWSSLEEKERAVGAVIRLNPAKKLGLMIDAVAILNARGRDIKVVLAGTGPERESLEEHARKRGVRCEFLGAVYSPAEIAAFYRRIMVTVIPSTAGLTTIQSMSHGVPVITDDRDDTQAPEASAIVDGVTGSRFEANNADALAIEIEKWVDRIVGGDLHAARNCRNEIEARWSPDVQAQNMIDSLNNQYGEGTT